MPKLYGSVNGQTKQIKKLYGSVNGQTKQIKKLYGSVNGQTKQIKKLYGSAETVVWSGALSPWNGPIVAFDAAIAQNFMTGTAGSLYVNRGKTISSLFVQQDGSAYLITAYYTDGTSEATRRFNGSYSIGRNYLGAFGMTASSNPGVSESTITMSYSTEYRSKLIYSKA